MGVFIYEFRKGVQVYHLFKSKMIDSLNLVLLEPLKYGRLKKQQIKVNILKEAKDHK